jgi:hypothetical protein
MATFCRTVSSLLSIQREIRAVEDDQCQEQLPGCDKHLRVLSASPREETGALIVIGDASGKGLKAAMTVSLIVGTLRTLAEYTPNPAEILLGVNRPCARTTDPPASRLLTATTGLARRFDTLGAC